MVIFPTVCIAVTMGESLQLLMSFLAHPNEQVNTC